MADPVFFPPSRSLTAAEIASFTGANLANPDLADRAVLGIAPLTEAGATALVYVDKPKNSAPLAKLRAAAIICPAALASLVPAGIAVLISTKPQMDFAAIARLLFPQAARPGALTGETGISPGAAVSDKANIEPGAIVETGAVIAANASVGSGTVIGPNAVIGPYVQIGRNGYVGSGCTVLAALIGNRVIIHAGVRIGQDGFGYIAGGKGLEKVPQIGRVIIQDDVEVGANTTIDRGALADTVIGEGTKIDNLVQIAHNVRIGRHCAIAAHSGISGSVTIGDGVLLGGRVGIADHVTIGDGAQLAANSGVMNDVPSGEKWAGAPAKSLKEFFREVATLRGLAEERKKKGAGGG